jgi:Fe-S-cluster containining protein
MTDRPARLVTLPEPMRRYACNQQGCCCQGWRIPFKPHDLVRLGRYLPPEQLGTDLDVRRAISDTGDETVRDVSILDAEGRCRFLDADHKGCTVHATHGVEALPDICVDFPVASYALGDGAEFFFDPVCPSVLDRLAESDDPLALVDVPPSPSDGGFSRRAAHARPTPVMRVGARLLGAEAFDRVRRTIVTSLQDGARTPVQHLHAIDAAYAEVARGDAFVLSYERDPRPYARFFQQRLAEHGAGTLARVFETYKRFLFSIPLDRKSGAWDEFQKHLRSWEPAMERWYTPTEQALHPMQRRYLAHRHAMPFLTLQGELHFAAGALVSMLATALRYAAAFGAVFRRPVDRNILKAALGTSEYVYRSLEISPSSLPWFGISD